MVRPAHAQPCATAHQPNLVARKTRLYIRLFAWHSGLLPRFFRFHLAVSRWGWLPMWLDLGLKQHVSMAQTIASDMVYPYSRWFFKYKEQMRPQASFKKESLSWSCTSDCVLGNTKSFTNEGLWVAVFNCMEDSPVFCPLCPLNGGTCFAF